MTNNSPEGLQSQIDSRRREIYTSKMTMSIGELTNMYRDGELELQPEFQRLFRWSIVQKSRLIESLLLGIPLPSIFVHQRQDGVWDVIDGVQRLSTILEFMGFLIDSVKGERYPASQLAGTDYLPALADCYWDSGLGSPSLTLDQQRIIKRAIIDVSIVSRESEANTKFDLFQRLNSGGSQLSDQEVRNALLVLANRDFFSWFGRLAETDAFVSSTSLSGKNLEERYDLELVLRFLIFVNVPEHDLRGIKDLSDYLTKKSLELAEHFDSKRHELEDLFTRTFNLIDSVFTGQEAFKRYSQDKKKHLGGFLVSAFEFITVGVALNLDDLEALEPEQLKNFLSERVRGMWNDTIFTRNSGAGVRANTRISANIPEAKNFFKP